MYLGFGTERPRGKAFALAATNRPYAAPTLTHHGTVADLTLAHHLVLGTKAVQFAAAFAASTGPNVVGTPTETVTTLPGAAQNVTSPGGATTHIVNTPGAGTGGRNITNVVNPGGNAAAGVHGGAGAGGKELPFTGLAILGVAGVGAALSSAGLMLRRLTGRRGDIA
jgi:hypothetical protein